MSTSDTIRCEAGGTTCCPLTPAGEVVCCTMQHVMWMTALSLSSFALYLIRFANASGTLFFASCEEAAPPLPPDWVEIEHWSIKVCLCLFMLCLSLCPSVCLYVSVCVCVVMESHAVSPSPLLTQPWRRSVCIHSVRGLAILP